MASDDESVDDAAPISESYRPHTSQSVSGETPRTETATDRPYHQQTPSHRETEREHEREVERDTEPEPEPKSESESESERQSSSLLPALPFSTREPYVPDLPDPRPYIEIRPTGESPTPRLVGESLRTLASRLQSETEGGFWKRVRGRTCQPALEWVLVSDGREDASVRWLVGLTLGDGTEETAAQTAAILADRPVHRVLDVDRDAADEDADALERTARVEDLFATLETTLRRMLPASYELTRVQWHPRYVEEHLPVRYVDAESDATGGVPRDPDAVHPAMTLDDPYVAGVQFRGCATFARDWLLPLQAFAPRPTRRVRRAVSSGRRAPRGYDSSRSSRSSRSPPGPSSTAGSQSHRRTENDPVSSSSGGGGERGVDTTAAPVRDAYHPVADVVEALSTAALPTIYQVVCRPSDWTDAVADYTADLRTRDITIADKVQRLVFPDSHSDGTLPRSYEERLVGLDARDDSGFAVATRLAVVTRERPGLANSLAQQFAGLLRPLAEPLGNHRIESVLVTDDDVHAGRTPPGRTLFDRLTDRDVPTPSYDTRQWRRLGRRTPSEGIVATAAELPGFCLVDGAQLTPHGERALATRPRERTGLVLPPPGQLAPYRGAGMALCMPLTHDRRPTGRPLVLPEALQNRHLVVAGGTGAGKSVLMNGMLRSNIDRCGGLHILLDYKGTDSSQEFLKTHYAARGTLDDVYYFDLTETLPAVSLFDIRPLLDAGVNREEARSRVAANYVEILRALMTPEKFDTALYAGDIIEKHIRALFDPIHGRDVFSHRDLVEALRGTRDMEPPPVSTDDLAGEFTDLLGERQDIFEAKINATISRVNVINSDERLRPLFTDMAEQSAAPDASPPSFGFHDLLDEDVTVVFDFGGMDTAMKNGLTLAILSALWSALTCRAEVTQYASTGTATDETAARRLVNLVLEEGGNVADTALVDTLLREGRSFGLSVALGVQFPEQLRSADPDRNTYRELINEVGTFVIGNVRLDDDLARALATEAMPPAQVANRLRSLGGGEWLVRPAAGFGAEPPRPFLAQSLPPVPGHPAGADPLDDSDGLKFDIAFVRAMAESTRYGYSHAEPATGEVLAPHLDWPSIDGAVETGGSASRDATAANAATESTASESSGSGSGPDAADSTLPSRTEINSVLPHTTRLSSFLDYDADRDFLHCVECGTRYDSTFRGQCEGIECCHSLAEVDRDDIPPSQSFLKRSPDEVERSRWSLTQHLLMQLVFNAQQRVYDPLEYDLTRDSMNRLREYVDISAEEVRELLDEGLLREDTTYPHRLYSLAPRARSIIGEAYREGVDFGDGQGDLEESSEHVMLNQQAAQWAQARYVDDPDHPGVEVKQYHELEDGRRLDCAVLNGEREVCVAIEAERINHDSREAVPADFDKLASCEPLEAIWVVSGRQDAHAVLRALNDPLDGEPRVTKQYSESSPPQRWRIDEPGFTACHTFQWLRRHLDESTREQS